MIFVNDDRRDDYDYVEFLRLVETQVSLTKREKRLERNYDNDLSHDRQEDLSI